METKFRRPPAEEEIDLTILFTNVLLFFHKNSKRILIFSALGILLGVIFYNISPRTYDSKLIADSGVLPNAEIISIVESWQTLIKKGDYNALASVLGISYDMAVKIKALEADNTGLPIQPQPTDNKANSFFINITVSDAQIFDSLGTAIIRSLENNDYIKKRIAIKKENLNSLKKKILDEITDLELVKISLQGLLKNEAASKSSTFLTDPANVNVEIVNLYERSLQIDGEIKLINDIQVIESFTKSDKPDNPKLVKCLAIGLAVGLFLFSIVAIIRAIKEKFARMAS